MLEVKVKREVEASCCCCSRSDDLISMLDPQECEGEVEIYAAMITECFQLEMSNRIDDAYRHLFMICKLCISHLKDALRLRFRFQLAYDHVRDAMHHILPETSRSMHFGKNHLTTITSNAGNCMSFLGNATNIINDLDGAFIEDGRETFTIEKPLKISTGFKCKPFTKQIGNAKQSRRVQVLAPNITKFPNILYKNPNAYRRNKDKIYRCRYCNKVFSSSSNLSRHTMLHSGIQPYECDHCGAKFKYKERLTYHIASHIKIGFAFCNICQKSFSRESYLKKHMATHDPNKRNGGKIIKCDICSEPFTKKLYLKEHMQIHSNTKNYICDYCEVAFTRKDNLKTHMITHTKVGLMYCKICNKSCTTRTKLEVHMNTHNNVCDCCGMLFERRDLKGHMETHFKNSMPYCEICDIFFDNKVDLRDHMNIHIDADLSGYNVPYCKVCKKWFTSMIRLREHTDIHNIAKSRCPVCGKGFSSKSNLTKHIATHSKIKPHVCNICGKAFTSKSNLKRHEFSQH